MKFLLILYLLNPNGDVSERPFAVTSDKDDCVLAGVAMSTYYAFMYDLRVEYRCFPM